MGIPTALHTVFLEGVPQLTRNDINRVRLLSAAAEMLPSYSTTLLTTFAHHPICIHNHLYLYILNRIMAFHTVFLEGVPQLTRNDINRVGAILCICTHLYLYIVKSNLYTHLYMYTMK